MSSHALSLRDVRVERGNRETLAIDALSIGRGELVAVVGPNGSGKSTLLQVVNGLLPTVRGSVHVLGEPLEPSTALAIRRRCALVFQDPLMLHGTVFDNVAVAPRFRRYRPARVQELVQRALRAFRCEHLAGRPAQQLSGGEVRRVCLARALVCDPELVMLDEPFTALDTPTRSALVQELRAIALDRGTTVLLVTHDFDDVLSFAQRALVLLEGGVAQDGPPEAILRQPVHEAVARLVSMDNMVACEAEPDESGTQVRMPNGASFRIRGRRLSGEGLCCLAGDALTLTHAAPQSLVRLEGRVSHIVPGVGSHRVAVECGKVCLVVRVARESAETLQPGRRVYVAFDPAAVHWLPAPQGSKN